VSGLLVQVSGMTKRFPGILALDSVSFDIFRGEVHGIVGENGAGKSTLMKILAGSQTADEGSITLEGRQVRFHNPLEAQRAGIGIVYQELSVFPNLSIAENVFANRQPGISGLLRRHELHRRTRNLLDLFGLPMDPGTPVRMLGMADRQITEILRAVSLDPKVLILDEPTSSLTQAEVERLFQLVEQLKLRGLTVLYISHQLDEILRLSDRVTVLRDGKYIGTLEKSAATEEKLVSMMVGRAVDLYKASARSGRAGKVVLKAEEVGYGKVVARASFDLHEGEILGFAGLVGAGRTELARTVFGITPPDKGRLFVDGEPYAARTPREAITRGIALVPEDRKTQGLFLPMLIRDNMAAPQLDRVSRFGWIDEKMIDEVTRAYISRVGIVSRGPRQHAMTLSGGNQQKLMLSLWLALRPRILIVDEPTRGIDVGAKLEIHNLLRTLADDGVAIMLISSELPEIITMSDRVAVMHEGTLRAILPREEATQERIMAIASGIAMSGA